MFLWGLFGRTQESAVDVIILNEGHGIQGGYNVNVVSKVGGTGSKEWPLVH
jgi:hypothetical protein